MNNQLHIGVPYLETESGTARLCAELKLRGKKEILWFSIDAKYGPYLTDDRADAFVVGLLTSAMKDHAEIICDAPVSRRLLYQLRHYLIPILSANLPGYYAVGLRAEPTDVKLPCGNAVATGWTGGVDSMFTLMKSTQTEEPGHQLTHLMIANNGALEDKDNSALLAQLIQKAAGGVARELGLSVIGIETNLPELVREPFLAVTTYRHAAVILALQKLFRIYYHSTAYEFSRFSFDADNCSYFDLVLAANFCTDCTTFYPAYGAYSRVQKLKELSGYPLARRWLHPCIDPLPEQNCGRCGKCVRTMAALYGLGTLEQFSSVFDVNAFHKNLDWYMAQTLAHKESQHYGEALALMKARKITPSPAAQRMARTIRAAEKIVAAQKDWLTEKLFREESCDTHEA